MPPFDPKEYLREDKPAFDPKAYLAEDVGVGEDIAKGFAGGLGRGTAGTLGLGGDVGNLVRRGAGWGLEKLGYDEGARNQMLDRGAQAARIAVAVPGVGPLIGATTGPDTAAVTPQITRFTGDFYKPQTVPGQYAGTLGEFSAAAALPIPGSLAARAVNTVVPALASETAGQAYKGTAIEPYARFMGGVFGGLGAAKAITPAAAAPAARQRAVNVLEESGVPLTAGQRTGSGPIRWMEATASDMPGASGAAGRLVDRTKSGYDKAFTERAATRDELRARGVPDDVNLPDARAAAAIKEARSDEYNRILRSNTMQADPPLIQGLYGVEQRYAANSLPSQRKTGAHDIEQIRDNIVDHLVAGRGRATGEWYQKQREVLGKHQKSLENTDTAASQAMREMKRELDAAMARSLSPDDAAALQRNNLRYANMKQLENAVATGGEHLSPAAVAQGVRSGRIGQYGRAEGNLDELANAGAMIMKDLPQSGTQPRQAAQNLFNLPSAVLAGGAGGATFGIPGALAGIAAVATPPLAARAVVSRPGQAYLGNRLLPQRMRNVVAQTLAQQAISQRRESERRRREQRGR